MALYSAPSMLPPPPSKRSFGETPLGTKSIDFPRLDNNQMRTDQTTTTTAMSLLDVTDVTRRQHQQHQQRQFLLAGLPALDMHDTLMEVMMMNAEDSSSVNSSSPSCVDQIFEVHGRESFSSGISLSLSLSQPSSVRSSPSATPSSSDKQEHTAIFVPLKTRIKRSRLDAIANQLQSLSLPAAEEEKDDDLLTPTNEEEFQPQRVRRFHHAGPNLVAPIPVYPKNGSRPSRPIYNPASVSFRSIPPPCESTSSSLSSGMHSSSSTTMSLPVFKLSMRRTPAPLFGGPSLGADQYGTYLDKPLHDHVASSVSFPPEKMTNLPSSVFMPDL